MIKAKEFVYIVTNNQLAGFKDVFIPRVAAVCKMRKNCHHCELGDNTHCYAITVNKILKRIKFEEYYHARH